MGVISEPKWKAMRGEVAGRRGTRPARASRLGTAAIGFLVFAVSPLLAQTETVRAVADSSTKTLVALPPAILPAISSVLGHDDAQYGMQATADGYTARNAANHLTARYTATG